MSADVLRRAAALMRDRAEACEVDPDEENWYTLPADGVLSTWRRFAESAPDDAEHIASWHPAVALAVADLLEAVADERLPTPAGSLYTVTHLCTVVPCRHDGTWPCAPTEVGKQALAVARRYLGEEAS